jgi:hypothetical protein
MKASTGGNKPLVLHIVFYHGLGEMQTLFIGFYFAADVKMLKDILLLIYCNYLRL